MKRFFFIFLLPLIAAFSANVPYDLEVRLKNVEDTPNPPARPNLSKTNGIILTGEAVLLKATDEGLSYAVASNNSQPTGRLYNQTLGWAWGTRLLLGYAIPRDGWDISLSWFYFQNTHTNTPTSFNSSGYFAARLNPSLQSNSQDLFSSIAAQWKLNINQLDLILARPFYVSKFLTIEPRFGVRTLWLDQRFHLNYEASTFGFLQKQKNDFWGMGGTLAINTGWLLGGRWQIYANAGLGIVYGVFDILSTVQGKEATSALFSDTSRKPHASKSILDLAIGLSWDHLCSHKRFLIGVNLGWEQHVYFGQNNLPHFTSEQIAGVVVNNHTNLSLQGFAGGVKLRF